MKRTFVDFTTDKDVWATVSSWANENGYREVKSEGNYKVYQKGYGLLVAPMMLDIKVDGNKVHMEAYIRIPFITRLSALFLFPAEMKVESGGFVAIIPRNMGRNATNKLLEKFGVELIK